MIIYVYFCRLRHRKCQSGMPISTVDPGRRCVRPRPKGRPEKDYMIVMAYNGIKDTLVSIISLWV